MKISKFFYHHRLRLQKLLTAHGFIWAVNNRPLGGAKEKKSGKKLKHTLNDVKHHHMTHRWKAYEKILRMVTIIIIYDVIMTSL